MAEPKATTASTSQQLAQKISARSGKEVVRKVICFANNDVPEYLENLRRFEEESKKVRILVK